MIRVTIVDDHEMVRAGLMALIERFEDIEVASHFSDGERLLEDLTHSLPDVVLLDLRMETMDGIETVRRIRESGYDTRVIILSMFDDEAFVLESLEAGADGYLPKAGSDRELEEAIRSVHEGGLYISPSVARPLVMRMLEKTQGPQGGRLTVRQREVLRLIAEGLSTKEIAHQLDLSVKTVESHRAEIMQRLGIQDVASLVRYALREGLVSPGY